MWTRLDDALLDHQKLLIAGRAFTRLGNGRASALGFYAAGLMYTNKHLTDGFLPTAVVEEMGFANKPINAAEAMVKAGLWDAVEGGYKIHDYHDINPLARDVHERRKRDRERKQKGGRHRHGANGRR